jgi:predicted SAM-dependent methyltransferase
MLLRGYVNYDLVPFTDKHGRKTDVLGDIRQLAVHFSPGTANEIVAFHCFEHLAASDVAVVSDQCHQVLKSGGKLIVECPDLVKAFDYYVTKKGDDRGYAHCIMGGDSVRYGETWAHKSAWTGRMMSDLLGKKFKNVVVAPGTSHGRPDRDFRITCEKP